MARRYRMKPGNKKKTKQMYVVRDKKGKFVGWAEIHRSIAVDTRIKAKKIQTKPGHGNQGDYKKRKIKAKSKRKK